MLLSGARLALSLRRFELSERMARSVHSLLAGAPQTVPVEDLRVMAAFVLADSLGLQRDVAGAMAAQRIAIDAARVLGPGPSGIAKRGQARLLLSAKRHDESIVAFAEAAQLLAEAGDIEGRVRLLIERGRVEEQLGDWREARMSATTALRALPEDASDPELRITALELSANAAEKTRDRESVSLWEAAADAAAAAGQCPAGFRSAAARAARALLGAEQAHSLFDTALAEAGSAVGNEQVWYRSVVLHRRAGAFKNDQPLEAAADAAAAAAGYLRTGRVATAARCRWIEGDAKRLAGDDEGALDALRGGVDLARKASNEELAKTIDAALTKLLTDLDRL